MKIIYCIDSLVSSGGTERVVTTKLNWFATQSEHDVHVITLQEDEPPYFALDSRIKRLIIRVAPGDTKLYKTELAKILCKIKPDITVAVSGMAIDVLPSIKDGSKKVLEFHYTKNFLVNFVNGMRNDKLHILRVLKMRYLQWRLAQNAKKFDCFVGLTKRDVGLWGNPSNMTYIYNPLSFRSQRKSSCLKKRIIAVGSWTPAKGMDQLLEAFSQIAHKFSEWKLDLYGAGQDEEYLKAFIKQNNLEKQVFLHAPCKDIGEQLIESSIYAFPSRSDGFGLVITEAMECGLPTVAMDCECGPREIVTENTGIIVPDKDISAFAKALTYLMSNESIRVKMGRMAAYEVTRFYCENIMPQWVALFDNLIKSR